MLTPKGRVMAELSVMRLATDRFYVITGSGSELHDMRWLHEHINAHSDVRIDNVTGQYAVLGVVGPRARSLLQTLCFRDMSPAAFPFFAVKDIELAGVPVRAVRVSYSGELVCMYFLGIWVYLLLHPSLWNILYMYIIIDSFILPMIQYDRDGSCIIAWSSMQHFTSGC